MSLLHLETDSGRRQDPSSAGDDYAKGSSYILWTAIAAFILVTVGGAIFLLADRKPPVATGEITQVWTHAVHTINTPLDAAGVPTAAEAYDQVLVFAQVHLRNQSDQPIVLKEVLSNVTLDDGIHSSYAATNTDFDRIFIAYPELARYKTRGLTRDAIIQPGETLDGMIVSSFHVGKDQWTARQNMNFTIEFKLHPDLTLTPSGPITEK